MIWFRRIIALPLALIFIILSIPVLLFFRVNGTLGNPDFYNEQLRRADIYNFIYDDLLPAALAEANFAGDISEAGIDISQLKPYVIPGVARNPGGAGGKWSGALCLGRHGKL
jgi:hypothetical protein